MIVWAILLLILLVFVSKNYLTEGLETSLDASKDDLALAIQSIETAMKDPRMSTSQKLALQDALYYSRDIQKMYNPV